MKWVKKWTVPSSSTRGKSYTVAITEDGECGCSCIAWTRNRCECRHIKLVKSADGNYAVKGIVMELLKDAKGSQCFTLR